VVEAASAIGSSTATSPTPVKAPKPASDVVKATPLDAEAQAELDVSYETFIGEYMRKLHAGEIVGPVETFAERVAKNEVKIAPGPLEKDGAADPDFEAVRSAAADKRELLAKSKITLPKPYIRVNKKEMKEKATKVMDGSIYGIPVPPNYKEFEALGATWLTDAFQAAGTLDSDNKVEKILEYKKLPTTTADAKGGAGPKMIIKVKYEKPDPSLHTELFVKMPWFADGGTKADGVDITQKGADAYPEIAFYRYAGPLCPFKVPKYYFGELCRENTNFVLIIEAIPFGKRGKEAFEPYEILPLAEKYFDFKLQPRQRTEMYYTIMRAQGRMAAWYQLGYLDRIPKEAMGGFFSGMQAVGSFPWPPKLTEQQRTAKKKGADLIWGFWEELLTRAKRCYAPELTEPNFVTALMNCVKDISSYDRDVTAYFSMFPEYISLQHPNLNADNAFFWWNANGQMDCGIFDWDGAGPNNVCQVMTGSLTGAEAPEQDEHDVHWLKCFRDEYYRESGIRLDLSEMRRQWHLTYCIYLIHLGMQFNSAVFVQTPKAEWDTITSLWDERAVGKWNVRCYTFMADLAMKYLHIRWVKGGKKRLHIHDTFLEWKQYWEKEGMT